MALYELTVVKLSGQTEIRYTDRLPRIGDTLAIDGRKALSFPATTTLSMTTHESGSFAT